MLTAILAGSGARVVIPGAVAVRPGPTDEEIQFVDASGDVIVVFRRQDVMLFTSDGDSLERLVSLPDFKPSGRSS
jgi:hypothetical protein